MLHNRSGHYLLHDWLLNDLLHYWLRDWLLNLYNLRRHLLVGRW